MCLSACISVWLCVYVPEGDGLGPIFGSRIVVNKRQKNTRVKCPPESHLDHALRRTKADILFTLVSSGNVLLQLSGIVQRENNMLVSITKYIRQGVFNFFDMHLALLTTYERE